MHVPVLTTTIIIIAISSLFGGLILKMLATYVGNIPNATFANSILICLVSSTIYFAIRYLIGTDAYIAMPSQEIFIYNLIILSAAYIIVGKLVWKCEWLKFVKANIIWIIAYAIFMGFTISKFT